MKKPSRIVGPLAVFLSVGACAAPNTPPPRAPEPAAEPVSDVAPSAAPEPRQLPVALGAVGPVPSECQPFASGPAVCSPEGSPQEALAQALGLEDALARDQALGGLQGCDAFEPGVVLALRAGLAPPACADLIVGPELAAEVGSELGQVLTALVHGAHLNRLVVTAPRLEPPFSKQQFAEFSKTVLEDWVTTQARAIYEIAKHGSKLSGYARGVVAVEAGLADMRFVSVVRDVPLPEELARDAELEEAYFAELDVALGPWKERGRDAALVGLREFAAAGVLADPRVERARKLLSELYGGRRIDRLDGLIVPAPAAAASSPTETLVARLPTYLVPYVLPDLDASEPRVLALLLRNGLPGALRADLQSRPISAEANLALAWGLVRFGQTYWSSADFIAAESTLQRVPRTPQSELLLGIVQALKVGPRDAVDMMARGSAPVPASSLQTLDALARGQEPLAAAAAFDAAYILELWPPPGDPSFWQGLARRYAEAEARLTVAGDKARAKELANAARATAKSLLPAR